MSYLLRVMVLLVLSPVIASASEVVIDVKLSPAGSYKAETKKVTGSASMTSDGGVLAENVTIDMTSLDTSIELRNKHTKEHLMTEKYPQAKLIKATGKDGKGVAKIEIKGKQVDVKGTYKIEKGMLMAEFPMKISSVDIKNVRYMGVGVKDDVLVRINLPIQAGAKRSTASTKRAK